MGLFDFLRPRKKEFTVPFTDYVTSKFQNFFGLGSGQEQINQFRGWVYACVLARGEAMADIRLRLFKKSTEEEVVSHPMLDLLHNINPGMTFYDLVLGTSIYKDLEGDGFWFLARDNNGKGLPAEIWLLRPDKVAFIYDKNNPLELLGYKFTQQGGHETIFDADDIIPFKHFNPKGMHPLPSRGMSIIEAASDAVETDNEARRWNFAFFKNSARPDGFLMKDGEGAMDQDEYLRIKEQLNHEHGGSSNAHKIMIMGDGLKWQETTKTQQDMEFIQQRTFSRDEILAMFRVPKTALGIVEDVNRANADATNYIFALRTIRPLMKQFVNTLNEYLIPEFSETDLEFRFDSPVPEDRAQVTSEYAAGIDKWLTRNEIRRREGLEPSEKGDNIWGPLAVQVIDDVVQPAPKKTITMLPVAKRTNQEIAAAALASTLAEKKTVEQLVKEATAKIPKVKQVEQKKGLSDAAKKAHSVIWKKMVDVEMGNVKPKMNALFDKQQKEVIKNIKSEMKGLESSELHLKSVDDFMFDKPKAVKVSISLITPYLESWLQQGGDNGMSLTGADLAFTTDSPAVADFTAARSQFFGDSVTDTTYDELKTVLAEGVDAKESVDQLSTRVADYFDQAKDYRTDMIARTEVSSAANFGAQEAYKQAGVTQQEWQANDPEDAECQENDGEVVDIGDSFPSGDDSPPAHPNCICTTLPVFDDMSNTDNSDQ